MAKETNWKSSLEAIAFHNTKRSTLRQQERASVTDEGRKEKLNFTVDLRIGKDKLFFFLNFICYSKVQQLQLLLQSIHAQTDYTPKHTCNSTITTQGMPTVI